MDLGNLETVDAGRNGSVGGEDRGRPAGGEGFVEAEGGVAGHQFLDTLNPQEAGMALVGVEHLGRGGSGELLVRAQRLDSAHPQQELLLEPVVSAAAIEAVGDAARGVVVTGNVGVQQQEGNASDVGTPDVCQQSAPVGERE
ncbi:hypothetical protein AHiyo4_08190 [Arthrobacter sp. Hiyo4]|nr:hypothetical protein AHiyo4_08190 [Arthrobacter sp. Hiyo4]